MLYRLSQNLCQNSAKTVWKTQHEQLLVNRVVRPSKFMPNCMDCTKIHSEIYYSSYLAFCANKCCTTALKSMPILSKNIASVHLDFYAHLLMYGLQKSVRYGLFFLVAYCLEIRVALCLGTHALLQQMLSFFSSSTSPSSLSRSLNKKWMNYLQWVRPLALVDLMREGEGFSNLTVEIRLDGWLRFGVSSLTLTLVIKSPFNLHLTN